MISAAQQQQYLDRLGLTNLAKNQSELLTELHLAHLMKLPFENLDITFGRPIKLTQADIYHKLIIQQRGGFCYELNYGFYVLLTSLGFNVQLLSARVCHGEDYSEEFSHLLLLVELSNGHVIADVGFGDSFNTPLVLDGSILTEPHAMHKIVSEDNHYILLKRQNTPDWQPQYRFTTVPRQLSDFEPMANYHQTSPESIFTRKTACSMVTDNGRITLSNNKLITTEHDQKTEITIENAQHFRALLQQYFKVTLPDRFQVDEWFRKIVEST